MTINKQHQDDEISDRIGVVFFLNFAFTFIEFVGGLLTNSTAIMADAIHDLGDTLSIGLAWLLNKISRKHPDDAFTYGYYRFSLLGALINGVVLIVGRYGYCQNHFLNYLIQKCLTQQVCFG